ncbi:signal transduction histidine kinase [Mucilaginibacter sp. UYP25]|uniref:sensor histidine kinase n=1 Tax=unclassified Mucilaginibacter TaxID=2617802 RepID=UPI0033990715
MNSVTQNLSIPDSFKVIEEKTLRNNRAYYGIDKGVTLTQRAAKTENALESAGIGTWSFDLINNVLKICERCKKVIGIQTKNIVSRNSLFSLISKEQLPILLNAFKSVKEKGIPVDMQLPINFILSKTKQQKWVRITAIIAKAPCGSLTIIYGTISEIRTSSNIGVNWEDLMAIVSHEMKSPLSSIKLYVQLSRANAVKEHNQDMVKFLTSADQMVDKATNMLNYFITGPILDTGRLKLTVFEFNVTDLISEVVKEVQFIHPAHRLVFQSDPEILLHADRDRIGQVVENLLTNAIKYSPNKRPIIIECIKTENQLTISVKDQGIGLPAGEFTNVFDKYYRVENALEKKVTGSGIGLYLCKQIIDEHHGNIWVRSEENNGSTFYFNLPLFADH